MGVGHDRLRLGLGLGLGLDVGHHRLQSYAGNVDNVKCVV